MRTITYVSTAVSPFSPSELFALLEKSRTNNAQHEITGMLLYSDGNFMQTIEGPELAVRRLYGKICQDPTHYEVTLLLDEAATERSFADWSMGFANLNSEHLSIVPAFCDVFKRSASDDLPIKAGAAKILLSAFRQSARY